MDNSIPLPLPARAAWQQRLRFRQLMRPRCRDFTFCLGRPVGTEGHAEGGHSQTQFGRSDCFGRPDGEHPRVTDLGFEIYSRDQQTPEALAAYQKAEIKKWWPIIKEFGIKAE
jgi:hypothetical protein